MARSRNSTATAVNPSPRSRRARKEKPVEEAAVVIAPTTVGEVATQAAVVTPIVPEKPKPPELTPDQVNNLQKFINLAKLRAADDRGGRHNALYSAAQRVRAKLYEICSIYDNLQNYAYEGRPFHKDVIDFNAKVAHVIPEFEEARDKFNESYTHYRTLHEEKKKGRVEIPIKDQAEQDLRALLVNKEFKDVKFHEERGVGWQLCATTPKVVIEGVDFGQFKMMIDLAGNNWSDGLPIRAKALQPNEMDGYPHPHIQRDGRICTGDSNAPISNALKDGRLFDIFDILYGLIKTYNPDSPYVKISYWEGHQLLCVDCDTEVTERTAKTCCKCEAPLCTECFIQCKTCRANFCSKCADAKVCKCKLCISKEK